MDHVRDGNQHLHHKYTKNIVMLFIFNELFYIELTLNNFGMNKPGNHYYFNETINNWIRR